MTLVFLAAFGIIIAVQVADAVGDYERAKAALVRYQWLATASPNVLDTAMQLASDEAEAQLKAAKQGLALATAAGLLGFMAAVLAANRMVHRMRRLSHAARALAVGDYRRKIVIDTGDELQSLGESFNALGESLVEHEQRLAQQAEMLAGMVEAARVASASLDMRECGKAIAKALCAHLGASDAAVFGKDRVDGGIRIIGKSGERLRTDWKRLAAHSADSGEYLVITEQEYGRDAVAGAILVGVPLSTASGTLGAIVGRFNGGLTRDELKLGSIRADVLGAFAVHAASAVANAETHGRTERYSEALEGWVDHVSAVMHVTEAVSTSLNLDEALEALAKATATVLGADECVIFLPNREGHLVMNSCYASDERRALFEVADVAPGEAISGKAFAEKRCVSCCDGMASDDELVRRMAAEHNLRGMLSAPLLLGDAAIGVIALYCNGPRHFTQAEMHLVMSIAVHAAVFVRNAKLYTMEASIAEALQRSLMSEAPEQCRGLTFAGRYMPAHEEANVGGDFYDVTPLPNGKVAVVIGDVSGKGLAAAIHLAACKYMIKALVYTHPNDPAKVLGELNDSINYYFQQGFFVTMFLAIIDPDSRTVSYASAGHPPAFLITENGSMHSRLSSTGLPVGCGRPCKYENEHVDAVASDVLLLYTDGVTDAVREGSRLEIEGLHDMVFEAGGLMGSELVDRIFDGLGSFDPSRKDDVALLAVSFADVAAASEAVGGQTSGETGSIAASAG